MNAFKEKAYDLLLLYKRLRGDISKIDLPLIDAVLEREIKRQRSTLDRVMSYRSSQAEFMAEQERAFPADSKFFDTGYYKTMLKRYFFAGFFFCSGKNVLDSCSGLGWGSYIVSHYARTLLAYDRSEEAISFCRSAWGSPNLSWLKGDALDLSLLKGKQFDVALAMETIEHFSSSDGSRYIEILSTAIKPGGYLVGTSGFPYSREEADKLCALNPYHPHIFTHDEISVILSRYFRKNVILNNWMMIAQK